MEDLRKVYENFVVNGVSALMGGAFDKKSVHDPKYEGLFNGIPNNYVGIALTENIYAKEYEDTTQATIDPLNTKPVTTGVHPDAVIALVVIFKNVIDIFGKDQSNLPVNKYAGLKATGEELLTTFNEDLIAIKNAADLVLQVPKDDKWDDADDTKTNDLTYRKTLTSGSTLKGKDVYAKLVSACNGIITLLSTANATYKEARDLFAPLIDITKNGHGYYQHETGTKVFNKEILDKAHNKATDGTYKLRTAIQALYNLLFPDHTPGDKPDNMLTPDMQKFINMQKKSTIGINFINKILKFTKGTTGISVNDIDKYTTVKLNDLVLSDLTWLDGIDKNNPTYSTAKPVYTRKKDTPNTWHLLTGGEVDFKTAAKELYTKICNKLNKKAGGAKRSSMRLQYGGTTVDELISMLDKIFKSKIFKIGIASDLEVSQWVNTLPVTATAKAYYEDLILKNKQNYITDLAKSKPTTSSGVNFDAEYTKLLKSITDNKGVWAKNKGIWSKNKKPFDDYFYERDQQSWYTSDLDDLFTCVHGKDLSECIKAIDDKNIATNIEINKIDVETAWHVLDGLEFGRTKNNTEVEPYEVWFNRTIKKLTPVDADAVKSLHTFTTKPQIVKMLKSFIALINANPDILSEKAQKSKGQNVYAKPEALDSTPTWFTQKIVKTSKLKELEEFLQRKDMNTAMDRSALSQFIGYPTGWLKDYQPFGVSSMLKSFGLYGGGIEEYDTLRQAAQTRPFVEMLDKIEVAKKALTEGKKYLSDEATKKLDAEVDDFKKLLDKLIKHYIIMNDALRFKDKLSDTNTGSIEELTELRKEHIPLLKGVSKRYDMLGRRLAQIFNSLVESPEGKSLIGNVHSALVQEKTPQRL